MNHKHFVQALDHEKITAAIARAEAQTTGQIRVFVSHRNVEDAVQTARERFAKLGLEKTTSRNAVLIYFAPEARKYAVVGDDGIHAKCEGDEFWKTLVSGTMRPLLKEERYTDAIIAAVEQVGQELAAHFPRAAGDQPNELPDAVEED